MNKFTDEYLLKLFNRYNEKYFNGRLKIKSVQWAGLIASAGNCHYEKKIIKVSIHYHMKHPTEISDTLLHEMIHLKYHDHGKKFYEELDRIKKLGGKVSRYGQESATKRKYHWRYECTHCGSKFKRIKRNPPKYKCGICKHRLREELI